jgi:hypothetical protein
MMVLEETFLQHVANVSGTGTAAVSAFAGKWSGGADSYNEAAGFFRPQRILYLPSAKGWYIGSGQMSTIRQVKLSTSYFPPRYYVTAAASRVSDDRTTARSSEGGHLTVEYSEPRRQGFDAAGECWGPSSVENRVRFPSSPSFRIMASQDLEAVEMHESHRKDEGYQIQGKRGGGGVTSGRG